jgi:hypothetical protein
MPPFGWERLEAVLHHHLAQQRTIRERIRRQFGERMRRALGEVVVCRRHRCFSATAQIDQREIDRRAAIVA